MLERYPEYWRGWAGDHFEASRFGLSTEPETRRALIENGEADIATTLPLATVRELEANPELLVDRRFTLAVSYLAMTVAGPLRSREARQALCWAFPYDEVIVASTRGTPSGQSARWPSCAVASIRTRSSTHTDLDRARALLQRAGVARGHDDLLRPARRGTARPPRSPSFSRQTSRRSDCGSTSRSSTSRPTSVSLFGDLPAEERPNLFSVFWSPDYNDAWNQLWPQVSCAAWQAGNVGQYCNARVEELLEEARPLARRGALSRGAGEIQQIVTRDDPAAIYVAQARVADRAAPRLHQVRL